MIELHITKLLSFLLKLSIFYFSKLISSWLDWFLNYKYIYIL